MNSPDNFYQQIDHRFNLLCLSNVIAKQNEGMEIEGLVSFEQAEQANARRELLRIEKLANRDKELNQKSEQHFVNGIADLVHQEIGRRLAPQMQDAEALYSKVLQLHESLPDLLDVMAVKATSVSRIEPIAANIPWAFDDLIKMVNQPKYRRTDAKGRVVNIETLRMALNYLGVDNLRIVIPSLVLRRAIPKITDPFPENKLRLWELGLSQAISAKVLASHHDISSYQAFTLGTLMTLGKVALTRLYLREFETVQQDSLREAQRDRKRDEHDALFKVTPRAEFLVDLYHKHGHKIVALLIQRMDMRRVFIGQAMEEIANNVPLQDMSPMALTCVQAEAYSKYRLLHSHGMVTLDEAKLWLRQFQFPPGAIAELQKTNLRNLNLSMP